MKSLWMIVLFSAVITGTICLGTVLAEENPEAEGNPDTPRGKSADEIARELANPATPMSSISNHLEYRLYDGDLPGASSRQSWMYTLQPAFPFDLGEGQIFALRPAFPVLIQQPVYDTEAGRFKYKSGLGDISFDSIYGKTFPSGLVLLGGMFGVLPTATDEVLGKDQLQLGPEFLASKVGHWGAAGFLFFHVWDVAGDDPHTSISSLQYIYAINLGNAYQLASSPTIIYDWEAESDQAWTVPLGVGLAKTVILGETPLKLQCQVFYNVEKPDAFASDWGLKLSISPVVANPFVGLF